MTDQMKAPLNTHSSIIPAPDPEVAAMAGLIKGSELLKVRRNQDFNQLCPLFVPTKRPDTFVQSCLTCHDDNLLAKMRGVHTF